MFSCRPLAHHIHIGCSLVFIGCILVFIVWSWCHGTSGYCLCVSGLSCVPWGLRGLLLYWYSHLLCCLILVFVAQKNILIIRHIRHFILFGACTTSCRNSIYSASPLAKVTSAIFKLCKDSYPHGSGNASPSATHCAHTTLADTPCNSILTANTTSRN